MKVANTLKQVRCHNDNCNTENYEVIKKAINTMPEYLNIRPKQARKKNKKNDHNQEDNLTEKFKKIKIIESSDEISSDEDYTKRKTKKKTKR